jgi:hypothetical protein
MKHFIHGISFFLVALLVAAGAATAQQTASRFVPDKNYTVTIKKTLSGNDGFQDLPPTTSTQRVHIVTGAAAGGGVPVEATVYRTQQRGEEASNDIDWQFRFTAMDDGSIGDLQVTSSAEAIDDNLAFAMLSRMMEPVLFHTVYSLRKANKDRVVLGTARPRDGARNYIDVEYTVDFSASEADKTVERGPLATEARGTALFNTDLQFFTERTHNEVSRIFIAEDALGSEKNVRMDRTVRVEVVVGDR